MTPDERKLLNELADNVAQAPTPQRDPEAEDIIRTRIGKRPDALYMMTQTVLIQNLALQRAQQQIRELQSRTGSQSQVGSGGFLGQGSSANYSYGQGGGQQNYAPPPPQHSVASSGGGSSFLRGAAQTAAGVAAGTLAAEAIGSMFSHGGGLFGGGGSGFLGGDTPREEIVNNYYDSPQGDYQANDRGDSFVDPGDTNDSGSYDDSAQYDDTSIDDGSLDAGDDSSLV